MTPARYSTNLALTLARIAHDLGLRDEVVRLMAMCRPEGLAESLAVAKARLDFGLD